MRGGGQPTYDAPVANRDSAFLWETEVLRSSRRPDRSAGRSNRLITDGEDWLTIREAADTTGVPSSTIRKWARHEKIPSYLEQTGDGYLRIVSMSGIREWAHEIGREMEVSDRDTATEELDLSGGEEQQPEPEIPEGTMLVPLDAWNKMLNQLGNLHEAGQQLAEARERAAKAETEALFLKERLRELREEKEREAVPGTPPAEPSTAEEQAGSTRSFLRRIYSDWRRSRRS